MRVDYFRVICMHNDSILHVCNRPKHSKSLYIVLYYKRRYDF